MVGHWLCLIDMLAQSLDTARQSIDVEVDVPFPERDPQLHMKPCSEVSKSCSSQNGGVHETQRGTLNRHALNFRKALNHTQHCICQADHSFVFISAILSVPKLHLRRLNLYSRNKSGSFSPFSGHHGAFSLRSMAEVLPRSIVEPLQPSATWPSIVPQLPSGTR